MNSEEVRMPDVRLLYPFAVAFHPVFTFLWAALVYIFFSGKFALEWFSWSLLWTVFIPISVTLLLSRGLELPDRRQRLLPLLATSLTYFAGVFFLENTHLPGELLHLLWVLSAGIGLLFLMTFFMKVSLHGAGLGIIFFFLLHGLTTGFMSAESTFTKSGLLVITLTLMVAVISQRLLSRAHTWQELTTGFVTGIVVSLIFHFLQIIG